MSITEINLNELGKSFFRKYGENIEQSGKFYVPQFHRDMVGVLPEKFKIMASSSLTQFQSYISEDERIVCFQGKIFFYFFFIFILYFIFIFILF